MAGTWLLLLGGNDTLDGVAVEAGLSAALESWGVLPRDLYEVWLPSEARYLPGGTRRVNHTAAHVLLWCQGRKVYTVLFPPHWGMHLRDAPTKRDTWLLRLALGARADTQTPIKEIGVVIFHKQARRAHALLQAVEALRAERACVQLYNHVHTDPPTEAS